MFNSIHEQHFSGAKINTRIAAGQQIQKSCSFDFKNYEDCEELCALPLQIEWKPEFYLQAGCLWESQIETGYGYLTSDSDNFLQLESF